MLEWLQSKSETGPVKVQTETPEHVEKPEDVSHYPRALETENGLYKVRN